METITLFLIAIALAMDSFAVAIANGITIRDLNIKRILTISFSLSAFQALMPVLGWLAGIGIENYLAHIDHWIAFILLLYIGVKMIYEGLHKNDENADTELKTLTLIIQSLATSIDAFAVGISFALLQIEIITPVIIIGGVTFFFSWLGLQIGKRVGNKLGKSVEVVGGIILIAIGTKILIEHLMF